jgi:branched-chain amino acid transport system substrate-binding protein
MNRPMIRPMIHLATLLAASAAFAATSLSARADTIHVGVVISQTGPAASLGIPQRNSIALLPRQIAGQTIQYDVLDDATDASKAVADMRKLIDEDHADVILGSSATPASAAMSGVAAEKQVPMISFAASASLIQPMDATKAWVFKTPQNDALMADALAGYMAKAGVKNLGFIGFNDAYGDGWLTEMTRAANAKAIKIVDVERYARPDTSVTGQVLRLMSAKPDAVLVAGAGTPAVLPQKTLRERGYTGTIYQTHGVAVMDFIRVGGKDVEGTILPAGPVLVADQLPDSNPSKAVALDYVHKYEAAYGKGSVSAFGGHAWDGGLWLQRAIPVALKSGKPGTAAFRSALRSALENMKDVPMVHGIATTTPTDHNGLDTRARVMVIVHNGAFKLLPQ